MNLSKVTNSCQQLPIDELDQGDEAESKAGSYQTPGLGEETNLVDNSILIFMSQDSGR